MKELHENMERFDKADVKIAIIATQSRKSLRKFQEQNGYSFTFIPDTKRAITKAFKVLHRGTLEDNLALKFYIPIKSTFLLDKEMRVKWRYVGRDKKDNPPLEDILSAITSCLPVASP